MYIRRSDSTPMAFEQPSSKSFRIRRRSTVRQFDIRAYFVAALIVIGSGSIQLADANRSSAASGSPSTAASAGGGGGRSLEYTISEELPVGTAIGSVKLDSDLGRQYGADELQRMRFHMRHVAGQPHDSRDLFAIDEASGELSTRRVIDRDRMCGSGQSAMTSSPCNVTFDVTVRPMTLFQIIRVVVRIDDVNDNAPTFPQDHVTLHVVETTPVGTLFLLPSAEDDDSGKLAVQEYQLRTVRGDAEFKDGPFELLTIAQMDGSKDVRLRLTTALDRETVDRYSMMVVAVDGGRPVPLSGTLVVDVEIGDANDHSPRFDGGDDNSTSYSVEVDENVAVMSPLIRVRAVDRDLGPNGEVVYGWAEATERSSGSIFGIDPDSGQVYVRARLDYEIEQVYQLTIKAIDRGIGSLPVYAKLTVRLRDVNDNPPSITVNALTGTDEAEVREHVDPPGSFVAHVAVTDADSGSNGEVECQLGSDDNNYFRLEPLPDAISEYKLITATVFDREERARHSVTLICEDHGEPRLTSRRVIIVDVVDINDHSPQLSSELIEASVFENSPPGIVVARINATDADEGRNKALNYRLVPVDMTASGTAAVGGLIIDPITGLVSTDRTFDYETLPRDFRFLVIVADRGIEPRTATATLHLVVIDVNDVRPRFDRPRYECIVSENVTVGSSVCRVMATDDDVTSSFRRIRYSASEVVVVGGGAAVGESSFHLDAISGVLKTVRKLDRETMAEYRFAVTATDADLHHPHRHGNNDSSRESTPMTTSLGVIDGASVAELTVIVADENDNRPVFLFPSTTSGSHVTVELRPMRRAMDGGGSGSSSSSSEADNGDSPPVVIGGGMLVVRLVARDADEGPNAELTYSITHGNEDGIFHVDAVTGVIIVSPIGPGIDVDRNVYRLVVSVVDGGSPRLAAVADLEVRVVVSTASELSSSEIGSQSQLDAGTIILLGGLAFGVVLVASAIAVAVVCVRRHDRRRRQRYLAVKRGDAVASTESATVTATEKGGGCISEPSMSNRCSELDSRSDHPLRCQCGYHDNGSCSLYHGNACDVGEPTTMTTTYSSVRAHSSNCHHGNLELPTSVTTCSDIHDVDDELTYLNGLDEHGPLHRGCGQCYGGCENQRIHGEMGVCYHGETVKSNCTPCVHVISPHAPVVGTAVAVSSPRCGSRNSSASCGCSCQQQQQPQQHRLMQCNPAQRPSRCYHHQHGHHHAGRHRNRHSSGGHHHYRSSTSRHRRGLTSAGSSVCGGSSTCSRSSLSPSSGASSAAHSPTRSVRHLADLSHAVGLMTSTADTLPDMLTVGLLQNRRALNDVTTGGQLTVDTELPVSAESDADAGNCSASDSGRGLSYEAFTDEMGIRAPRTRAKTSCNDSKLRAHALALEATTSESYPEPPKEAIK